MVIKGGRGVARRTGVARQATRQAALRAVPAKVEETDPDQNDHGRKASAGMPALCLVVRQGTLE